MDRLLYQFQQKGRSELAHMSTPRRMDGKWSRNKFLLGSNSLAIYGG
jgi:hypothetical protein